MCAVTPSLRPGPSLPPQTTPAASAAGAPQTILSNGRSRHPLTILALQTVARCRRFVLIRSLADTNRYTRYLPAASANILGLSLPVRTPSILFHMDRRHRRLLLATLLALAPGAAV